MINNITRARTMASNLESPANEENGIADGNDNNLDAPEDDGHCAKCKRNPPNCDCCMTTDVTLVNGNVNSAGKLIFYVCKQTCYTLSL